MLHSPFQKGYQSLPRYGLSCLQDLKRPIQKVLLMVFQITLGRDAELLATALAAPEAEE